MVKKTILSRAKYEHQSPRKPKCMSINKSKKTPGIVGHIRQTILFTPFAIASRFASLGELFHTFLELVGDVRWNKAITLSNVDSVIRNVV